MLHTGTAPPHSGMFSSVILCDPSVNLATLGAVNNAGYGILAAVNPLFPVSSAMKIRPPDHFLLHLHIKVTGNDGLMAVFHIILWDNPLVLHPLFIEKVNSIGLLQKGVSDVLFILQDLLQCFRTPLRFPSPGKNPVCLQATPDLEQACPFQILPVDPLHHFRFGRLDYQISFLILCVSKEPAVVDPYLSVLEAVLQAEFDVLAQRLAFLLCQTRHNGEQHFTFRIHDIVSFSKNDSRLPLYISSIKKHSNHNRSASLQKITFRSSFQNAIFVFLQYSSTLNFEFSETLGNSFQICRRLS